MKNVKINLRINKKNAFTLIEMLLGLTIFSLVSLLIYSTFWGGIKLDRRSEEQSQLYREARWAFEMMQNELESMVPYDFSASYPDLSSFIGKEDSVQFILPSNKGLKVVKYFIMGEDDADIAITWIGNRTSENVEVKNKNIKQIRSMYLMRSETSLIDYMSSENFDNGISEIVATGIKEDSLKFAYGFSQSENSSEVEWRGEWNNKYIPSHIGIEIEFIVPGQNQTTKIFKKKVLIPSGFLGTNEEI